MRFDVSGKENMQMRMIWIIRTTIALVSVFFLSGLVDASETIHLTVGEAVRMAIRENIGLKAERYLPLISMGDVLIEESAFDPDISLSLGESYERAMSPSIVTSTRQRSFDLDISLSGRVDAGTRYTVKWNYQKFRGDSSFLIINPYHLTELTVTVSQPLLKGFGRKNQRTMIAVAEGNKRISGYRLKGKMEETALKTINAYYNVLIAEERLNYARFSLRLAEDVREEVKAKIGAGVLSPVEVYKAESGVAKREEMVLKAGNGLKDAIDELRLLLGIRDWRREIVLSGEEEFSDGLPDIEASITKVLKYSNEIKQALLEKKNREMLQRFYLNQMLPDVELFGTVGVSGLSDTRADALDRLLKGADRTWQVGVSLRMPLFRKAERGRYLKAKYEQERAAARIDELRQRVVLDLRKKWRALELNLKRIAATGKTRLAEQKRLEAGEGRFREGLTTLNDLLKFQEEYTESLFEERKAVMDYLVSRAEFERAEGSLLSRFGIHP